MRKGLKGTISKTITGILLSLILVMTNFAGMLPGMTVMAASSGSCGDNATYTLDDDGNLTISGTGTVNVYAFKERTDIRTVTIEGTISDFGAYIFLGCTNITTVTLQNGISSTGTDMFKGCTSLTNVSLPQGITKIGAQTFLDCTNLTAITIPDSVTEIEAGAFQNSGLTSITIPDSVTTLKSYVFNKCTSLASVTIPNTISTIENGLFKDCTGLTSITIPDSVTSINDDAFNGCTNLTSITMSEALYNSNPNAFPEISSEVFSFNQHTITVTNDGHGTGTANPSSGVTGTEVTLTAHPDNGYKFKEWQVISGGVTLADTSSATTTFNIGTANVTVKAVFEKKSNPKPDPKHEDDDDDSDSGSSDSKPKEEKPYDYLDELRAKLKTAIDLGGYQTVTWDKGTALPYDIMKTLQDNPKITLGFSYTYENVDFKVTLIGQNVKAYTSIPWYGPLYLYAYYGGRGAIQNAPVINTTNRTYTVVRGDTLTGIAIKLNTSVNSLVSLNSIRNPDYIKPGQVLKY